ncbi:hypothetical protein [Rickettsiella massiliensis]|uniref:hypothetical protein n=1 Tax=Rickettsiella massiliensis TaxID=676517 RepID=UPI00029B130A|nr:hypothetical protein [Rickettsiella massiliensis]
MNIDKFFSKAQKSLQAYINLSVSLRKITLVTSAYQPEIKNLAFNKIKELKKKEEVISFLKNYNYSFLSFYQDHDYEGKPDFYRNFYFFVYFLSLVQEKYGKEFVQKTLFGQSTFNNDLDQRLEAEFGLWHNQELKKQNLWENFKSFIRAIFKYQETGKAIQESVSVNESLMYAPPKQALSSVKSPVELTGENLLIKYSPNILRMIYEMGKNLNPVSLIGVQHCSNPVSPKDGIDTNPNLYGESHYNSNYCLDSDSDSVSSCDSGLDSLKSVHSDSECSGSLSSSLPIEESRQQRKKKVLKSKRSEQERRFYSRREGKHNQSNADASDLGYESGDNVSTGRLQSENSQNLGVESRERILDPHLELKLEEKLKKCLERKEVYYRLYKRYESYQHNKVSKEELIDYQFKFKLNQALYHLYEDYIKKNKMVYLIAF